MLELKMLLDVLEDRGDSLGHVSTVLLRLSELLDVEGHMVASDQARELSFLASSEASASEGAKLLEEKFDADIDYLLEKDNVWVEVPGDIPKDDALDLLEMLEEDRGLLERLKKKAENPA